MHVTHVIYVCSPMYVHEEIYEVVAVQVQILLFSNCNNINFNIVFIMTCALDNHCHHSLQLYCFMITLL